MILVFGASADPHVRAVTGWLDAQGVGHGCLDLFDPGCPGLTLGAGPAARVVIGQGRDVADVRSVWWRLKPPERIVTDDIVAHYDQQFSFHEWAAVAGHAADSLSSAFWINRRDAERRASNKVHQIAEAHTVGLAVPQTLFTNSPAAARDFVGTAGRCVIKTFLPYLSPDLRQCHTSEVTIDRLESLGPAIGQCPVILQQLIEPEYELRVTVVGNDVFAARIDARRERQPDWRLETADDIFSRATLDPSLSGCILALMARFGLESGCIDLIKGRDGTVYFLEVNPAGQWLWLEERLGFAVSATLARRLAAGC